MPDAPATSRPQFPSSGLLAFLLLAVYAVTALAAALQKGPSFDETEELAVGYNIWQHQDFRMEVANGDLVKRWTTLPYLLTQPRLPGEDDPAWRDGRSYILGNSFFFSMGNAPEWLLLQARSMAVLSGVLLGALVYYCARRAFGDAGGLFALSLFVFNPNMLAYGGIVSTEMTTCLTLLGSTVCIWRLLHRVTWARLGASLGFFALLLLAKPSGLVIFPITAVLLAVRFIVNRPLDLQLRGQRNLVTRRAQAAAFLGIAVLHAVVGWAAIWAQYDFRYFASPDPADSSIVLRLNAEHDPIDPTVMAALDWSRGAHFLPEGFLAGIQRIASKNDERQSFLNGEWRLGGTPLFFPYALWAKTHPAIFFLLAFSLGASWAWWRRRAARPAHLPKPSSAWYRATPYLALVGIYLAVAMTQNLNIGYRHILPIVPPLYVLCGGAAAFLWATGIKWARGIQLALVLWLAVGTAQAYPDFLAYFSPFAGGAAQGYKHLVDSSLDWGMDLPELGRWLQRNNAAHPQSVFLAYFGTDNPEYENIQSTRLPGWFDWRPLKPYAMSPGIYAISATLLQSVYTPCFGPWNKAFEQDYQARLKNILIYEEAMEHPEQMRALLAKYPQKMWDDEFLLFEKLRFCRLCAWLRHHRPPDDSAGHSILIWRLTEAELYDALFGPPAELEDKPVSDV